MRAFLVLIGALLLAAPTAMADGEDVPELPDLDGIGPDPSGCRPYCIDGLPGPDPSTCRPYCDFMDDL